MKLVVLDGEMRGKVFPVTAAQTVLGRKSDADVCLATDKEISRFHCRLSEEDGTFWLEDLGSVNGTWVSGLRADGRVELGSRAVFRIGGTHLALLEDDDDDPPSMDRPAGDAASGKVDQGELRPGTVVQDQRSDDWFAVTGVADPEAVRELASESEEVEVLRTRLKAFQDVSEALAGKLEIRDLLQAVLDSVVKVIPAERAFLFRAGPGVDTLTPIVTWPRTDAPGPVAASRTLLDKVITGGVAVLIHDARADQSLMGQQSIRAGSIRSAMCVPLLHEGEVRAVLHIDASSARLFTQEDLELLTAIANQAALALVSSELYEDLQNAQAQLIESEKLSTIGTLAASIAHDVRNVLTPISMVSSRVLGMEGIDPRMKDVFERQIQRLRALAQQLLSFSRGDAATLGTADINKGVEECVALVQTEARHSEVHIQTELGEDLPPVQADLNRLDQVFVNLIINAIHAMEPEGGSIRIRTALENGHVVVSLADSGPGIPPEKLERIFEPFFTTKGSKGSGLGLFSSKRIVEEEHRGRLEVENRPGEGATFIVRLPVS